ncbi:glucosaminidase domain-containing protein, partial [Mycolicibacterium sp.]|uniref:glucosaminidase domain-containing protein n=1 Tax=Mycolicibacterium sp. TaxID=2320850 RepID=UPI0037C55445
MLTQPSLLTRPARALVALAIALIAAALTVAPAGAQTGVGTPVLGTSLLSAEQIAGWYAAGRVTSRSPTPVPTLAQLFVEEGAAQGVRGDLAFAQAMLETGYLRYGGQVRPSDHNFSGLGACDSCARGLAFPSATLGVRAQIQHLWAYASPTASVAGLAHPLADIRFDLVQPKGRAPLWETMGGGNWATDPD